METPNQFSFTRWLGAGFAFGLGFTLAVAVLVSLFAVSAGLFVIKKGSDLIGTVLSESGSTIDAEGVYLVNTNVTRVGSTIIVSGLLTNSTATAANDLTVSATLEGDFQSEGSSWETKHLDSLAAGASRELTFVYEDIGNDVDPEILSLALEITKSGD